MTQDVTLSADERTRWTRVGMLSALAMVLGYLETFIPIPIPGVKLGLANIPVLVALDDGDTGGAFCVGAIKVLTMGLLFGNPVTMAYSALGTLLAFAVMAPLSKVSDLHVVTISAAGAIAHVIGQLIVASALLGTSLVWYSLPPLQIAAGLTGVLCGMVTARALAIRAQLRSAPERVETAASRVNLENEPVEGGHAEGEPVEGGRVAGEPVKGDSPSGEPAVDGCAERKTPGTSGNSQSSPFGLPAGRTTQAHIKVNPRVALVCLIAFMIFVFNVQSVPLLGAAMAVAAVACALGRVGAKQIARALRPMAIIIVITLVAQIANFQQGEVIAHIGPFVVTSQALQQAGIMAARLVSVVGASLALMQLVELDDLVGAIRWLVGPLRRIGVRTEGFCHALEVALASVPAILSLARTQTWSWRELGKTAPEFIARAIDSPTSERDVSLGTVK